MVFQVRRGSWMMRAHLPAVDRIDLAHLLLDEGMSGTALHRLAAEPPDDVDGVPGQARVVDDARAGVTLQERLGQQPDQVIALDEAAVLVEEEAAVEIAIPGQADVRAAPAHRLDGAAAIGLDHRIGNAIGK